VLLESSKQYFVYKGSKIFSWRQSQNIRGKFCKVQLIQWQMMFLLCILEIQEGRYILKSRTLYFLSYYSTISRKFPNMQIKSTYVIICEVQKRHKHRRSKSYDFFFSRYIFKVETKCVISEAKPLLQYIVCTDRISHVFL
jgi:hypothetical protein